MRDYPAHEATKPRKLDGLRRRPVAEVAAQLGVAIVHGRLTCPACGVEGRACSVNPDGMGWRCWACDAKGDALILAGWVVCGRRVARGDDAGWTAISSALGGPVLDAPPPRVAPPRALVRPPGVAALWDACGRVDDDAEVSRWLESRGLDPDALARLDVVRAAPKRLPSWAPRGRRAVFAGRAVGGDVVTLRFRATDGRRPKTLPPCAPEGQHYDCGAAVMASIYALGLLVGDRPPAWDGRVFVAEGESDFATVAQQHPRAAVFGVWSGSWTTGIAERVPEDAVTVVATHHDKAGDKYAAAIAASLAGRCSRTTPGPDENDRWMATKPERLVAK